jgi:hypothetical protein
VGLGLALWLPAACDTAGNGRTAAPPAEPSGPAAPTAGTGLPPASNRDAGLPGRTPPAQPLEPPGQATSATDASLPIAAGDSSAPSRDDMADAAAPPPADDGACTALLCDHFDDQKTGEAPGNGWKVVEGSMKIDGTHAFSGGNAVYVSDPTGHNHAGIMARSGAPAFPLPGNGMYGRMMVWLSAVPNGPGAWSKMIMASGPLPGKPGFTATYAYGNGGGRVMTHFETAPTKSDCSLGSTMTAYPQKRWFCLEWLFEGKEGKKNELHLWIDGAEVAENALVERGGRCAHGTSVTGGPWSAPTFEELKLGWSGWGRSTANKAHVELWIDDIAIDDERIGCPKPGPTTR